MFIQILLEKPPHNSGMLPGCTDSLRNEILEARLGHAASQEAAESTDSEFNISHRIIVKEKVINNLPMNTPGSQNAFKMFF